MNVELVDQMGTDLTVCNSARVSFDKTSEWERNCQYCGDGYDENGNPVCWLYDEVCISGEHMKKGLSQKDQKLISYLANHEHFTPFTHVMITMRETVPIFVARQRFKHVIGFSYNEISRRYVNDQPEFYVPDVWRGKPVNAKQGSSDETVEYIVDHINSEPYGLMSGAYSNFIDSVTALYNDMIHCGVAPEQARMVLPQSLYTSYYVTGSLAAWARAYKLRSDSHAQKEIQDLAAMWHDIIGNIDELKYSWQALTN